MGGSAVDVTPPPPPPISHRILGNVRSLPIRRKFPGIFCWRGRYGELRWVETLLRATNRLRVREYLLPDSPYCLAIRVRWLVNFILFVGWEGGRAGRRRIRLLFDLSYCSVRMDRHTHIVSSPSHLILHRERWLWWTSSAVSDQLLDLCWIRNVAQVSGQHRSSARRYQPDESTERR